MRLAIMALAFVAFLVPAYAQDDNGGGGDDGATAAEPVASVEERASDAIASHEVSQEEVACLPGGVTEAGVQCTAALESGTSDPFATVNDPPTPKLIDFLGKTSPDP